LRRCLLVDGHFDDSVVAARLPNRLQTAQSVDLRLA
jgi:hypothetical protein